MVVTGSQSSSPAQRDPEVIWHELECGGYRADLALWRELASNSNGEPILEIGSGSGRVALDLARAGHRVTALDRDSRLLDALSARAAAENLDLPVVCADARAFDLGRRRFGLCLVPMQTVQLLGGEAGRAAFLRRARTHLRPGGLLACAIVTDFDYFDCTGGDPGPAAETLRVQDAEYASRAIRVLAHEERVVIERERSVLPPARQRPRRGSGVWRLSSDSREPARERDVIELDLVTVGQIEREAQAAGLRPAPARTIEGTADYVPSAVVMLDG
jgi:SAM-dependent methyltransferase